MMKFLKNSISMYRAASLLERSPYRRQLADVPARLFHYWQDNAHREFKGIPSDAFFFTNASEGLMCFFDCAHVSERPCGLPSMAADSVWHAWLAFDPVGLERFCKRHFGRTIAHTPADEMAVPMPEALAHTLVRARSREGQMRAGASLPRLFTLDQRVRMPGGYAYQLACGLIGYQMIGLSGTPGGNVIYPGSLESDQLLMAGLITQAEFDEQVARAQHGSDGSFDLSSSFGDSAGDGDAVVSLPESQIIWQSAK